VLQQSINSDRNEVCGRLVFDCARARSFHLRRGNATGGVPCVKNSLPTAFWR
jgi:hypothetical protein